VGVLVLVCALGGGVDLLSNSVAQWAARMASFPEEEEQQTAKDRSSLVAAGQPSRKGGLRPTIAAPRHASPIFVSSAGTPAARTHAQSVHRSLTGAGIFQRC
jgi:hypothetical protein